MACERLGLPDVSTAGYNDKLGASWTPRNQNDRRFAHDETGSRMPQRLLSHCPGPLNRRHWLQLGGLSLGALCNGLQPRDWQLHAAEDGPGDDFSVILFWANGGPSHLDLFDLKPDAPSEYRGPFQPIATNVAGMQISELLPGLARRADKFTLLRSLHHERTEHSGGTNRFLTGYPSVAANLADSEFPEIGSVVSRQLGAAMDGLPLFIANTKFYGGGPAYLGAAHKPYMPSPNPLTSSGNNSYAPVPLYRDPGQVDRLAISPDGVIALRRRQELLQLLDRFPRALDVKGRLDSLDEIQRRAAEMLAGSRTRRAFDLTRETAATRERYGHTHWGKSLLTCRRLVEAGVRFVQCQATFRLKKSTGRTSNWDDHSVNSNLFLAYREKLPSFDQSLSALIDDLDLCGLAQRVLLVFCGEFGRTPQIRHQDPSGRPGRDHWSRAMSVLLAGGGLRMGQVIGKTNRRAEEPVERIMDSNCLLATLYHRFGIDSAGAYLDHAGRPIPILTEGEPIRELF
ncbi:MAG: DUF1501 domain-containing protein [Planctomycetota bacterium]|nr:DUF1501 domain-containing protein [Planctomycetota bacterium]